MEGSNLLESESVPVRASVLLIAVGGIAGIRCREWRHSLDEGREDRKSDAGEVQDWR